MYVCNSAGKLAFLTLPFARSRHTVTDCSFAIQMSARSSANGRWLSQAFDCVESRVYVSEAQADLSTVGAGSLLGLSSNTGQRDYKHSAVLHNIARTLPFFQALCMFLALQMVLHMQSRAQSSCKHPAMAIAPHQTCVIDRPGKPA